MGIALSLTWFTGAHTLTDPPKLLSEFLVSYMGVFCCLFVLCHLAAPDEGEQSDETENGTV